MKPTYSSSDTKPSRRHDWRFSREQLIELLKAHINNIGVSVPKGATYIWGLEADNSGGDGVNLVIDEQL